MTAFGGSELHVLCCCSVEMFVYNRKVKHKCNAWLWNVTSSPIRIFVLGKQNYM